MCVYVYMHACYILYLYTFVSVMFYIYMPLQEIFSLVSPDSYKPVNSKLRMSSKDSSVIWKGSPLDKYLEGQIFIICSMFWCTLFFKNYMLF